MDKLTIYTRSISVNLDYNPDPNKTADQTIAEIANTFGFARSKIRLFIARQNCFGDTKLGEYKSNFPDDRFIVYLASYTPIEYIYNMRCIKRIKYGDEQRVDECVVCLENRPDVAVGSCDHDSILCCSCLQKMKDNGNLSCPYCKTEMRQFQYYKNV
jgi:hypothetical protein